MYPTDLTGTQLMTELNHVPLAERLKKAEYLARELSEHLTQAYLPRLAELRGSSKIFDEELVSDQQMLDQIQAVLQSDEFATDVYQKLTVYLESIREEMQHLTLGGDTDLTSDDQTAS